MGTPSPQSDVTALMGETIILSAPKAVVEITEAEGAKTQTQSTVICSLAVTQNNYLIHPGWIEALRGGGGGKSS